MFVERSLAGRVASGYALQTMFARMPPTDCHRAYFNVPAGTFVPGEMKNVPGDWPSVPGEILSDLTILVL